MVKNKTRGENILDLVLVYERNFVFKIEHFAPVGNSDHDTIGITLNTMTCSPIQGLNMFNYNKANYEVLDIEVNKVDWDREVERLSVNDLWLLLIGILNNFKEKFIPKFKNRVNNEVPWLNATLKKMIKKRNNLYKRFNKSNQMYFKIKYKQMRNKVTKQIRILKEKYESKIIKRAKNNRKVFYTYVNSNKKGGGSRKVGPLMKESEEDGTEEIVEDDNSVAALLNDYFCTVFNRVKKEDKLNIMIESRKEEEVLDSINISDEDVKKAISAFKVNKSPGIDNITSTYAIKIKDIVAKPLRLLFNKSLQTNDIPEDWKKANITPIFKKGDKSLVENYRPVSLTVFFGKVMEKIVKQRIDKFLETNEQVNTTQHGFRKGRSCLTNLLVSEHSKMKIVDEGGQVDIVYLDFQKAFDKVPHARLMKKVRSYGIVGLVGGWIERWLEYRQQRVVINGRYSEWREVGSGVPQGSILGPLLFTLYINDIGNGLSNSLLNFADDTKLWGKVNSNEDVASMKEDLNKLSKWSKDNEMPFNVSKCCVMHVGKKNAKEVYKIDGLVIEKVKEIKDLGVFFTEGCKPTVNCNKVCKSASKIIGLIRRKVANKGMEGMLILYKTLVRPILDYCIPVWRPYLRKDINKLEKIQKRYTKMIKDCRGKNYQQRLKVIGLTSLEERHYRADMIQVFKVLKDKEDKTDVYPPDFLTLAERPGRKNSKKLYKKRNFLEICKNSFTARVVDSWNSLPEDVIIAEEVNIFKNKLDKYMRSVKGH